MNGYRRKLLGLGISIVEIFIFCLSSTSALAVAIPDASVTPGTYTMRTTLEWGGEMAGTVYDDFSSQLGQPGYVDVTLGDNYARSATNGGEGREIIAAASAQISGTAAPGTSWINTARVESNIDYYWRVEATDSAACALIPECAGITQVPVTATFSAETYALTSASMTALAWSFIGSQAFMGSDKLLMVDRSENFGGSGGYVFSSLLPPPDGPGFVDTFVPLGVEQDLTIRSEIHLGFIPQDGINDFYGKAVALVDPIIAIDPDFAYADIFEIHVSENIALNDPAIQAFAPPASVPLPGTSWLFGSGLLGLLIVAGRRITI